MNNILQYITPNRKKFESDPFGYSASARNKWELIKGINGFSENLTKSATSEELKNPILWMTQAEALTQAAIIIIKKEPKFENMPINLRGICDSQFCATGLMLVGYSLEICLKAMIIIKKGIDCYCAEEKKYSHHKLNQLADFIPNLNEKDIAILKILSHYVYWAERYPDPGFGKLDKLEEVFNLAEGHKITLKKLIDLAGRIMAFTKKVVEET